MEDLEPRDANEDDELEAEIMRADHAFATESVGTTAEEALEGETLDQRLAEERPERPETDEVLSVVDEGLSDDEEELVGEAVIERDEFASPEEAALTRARPGGASTGMRPARRAHDGVREIPGGRSQLDGDRGGMAAPRRALAGLSPFPDGPPLLREPVHVDLRDGCVVESSGRRRGEDLHADP